MFEMSERKHQNQFIKKEEWEMSEMSERKH